MSNPVDLAVRQQGSGKPLILLHGLFGQGMNFQGVMRRLSEQCSCTALDLRNHGRSPHVSRMTYLDMAADVAAYIRAHHPDGADIVGHSMGGKVAMALALSEPELVTGLVVADIAPVAYEHDFEFVVAPLRRLDLTTVESRADADLRLRPSIADAGLRMFLLTNLARDQQDWRWRVNLPAIEAAMPELMGFPESLKGKSNAGATLFLSGSESNYVATSTQQEACRQFFPAGRFLVIPGAGHWVHADEPALFVDALVNFLHR